jgi:DNA-binding NarL/FixJ family response regulator
MGSTAIALIDNHPITMVGLMQVLAESSDYSVVAKGSSSLDILSIADEYQPSVMIVDMAVPGNALAAISFIAKKYPNMRIIDFTAASGVDYAVAALEAGAQGYVSKTCSSDEIIIALRAVMTGQTYVSQNFAGSVITALRNASIRKLAMQALKLSAREDQIVHYLLVGKTNKEIAARLEISEKTVKHYMTILMQKLNARNRTEAVIAAQKLDLRPFSLDTALDREFIEVNY